MAEGTLEGGGGRTPATTRKLAPVWGVVALIAGVLVFGVSAASGLRPLIRDRLIADPSEAWFWGGLPVFIAGVAWLAFILVYRIGVSLEPTEPLPTPGNSRTLGPAWTSAGVFVGLAGWIYVAIFPTPTRPFRRSWRRDHLLHDFPELAQMAVSAVVFTIAVAVLIWWAVAVLRPWVHYVQRRAAAGGVDAVLDLGGPNAVKLVYRPTLGLGAPMRVRVGSRKPFVMVPGQALGILARSGAMTIKLQGRRTRLRDSMTVALKLAPGEGTVIVFNDGLFRRVKVTAVAGETHFVSAERPYVSMWSGLAYAGLKAHQEPGDTVRHVEADAASAPPAP